MALVISFGCTGFYVLLRSVELSVYVILSVESLSKTLGPKNGPSVLVH
jgi:hypothetical protein